jgi:hypothetical protein
MIKKTTLVCVACLVAALPGVSQAGKARTESAEYNTLVVNPDEGSPSASGQISNGVTFQPKKGERFITVVVEDASGLPTRAVVGQDYDGDGLNESETEVCGASSKPIRFKPGVEIHVSAQDLPCEDGSPAFATFGTITATFTR